MNKLPNIVFFYDKSSKKSNLLKYLDEKLSKVHYTFYELGFEPHSFKNTPWESGCRTIVLDHLQSEHLFKNFDKITAFVKETKGDVWFNTMSEDLQSFLIKCKSDFGLPHWTLKTINHGGYWCGSDNSSRSRVIVTDAKSFNHTEDAAFSKTILDELKLTTAEAVDASQNTLHDGGVFFGERGLFPLFDKLVNHQDGAQSGGGGMKIRLMCVNDNAFDFDTYSLHLSPELKSRPLVYFPEITTTFDFCNLVFSRGIDQLESIPSYVVVAGCQTEGRGRGPNRWVSIDGCLMFTVVHRVSNTIPLSLLQHAASLAVVKSVISHRPHSVLPLAIKWPNDIYIDGIKIGGVLVKTQTVGNIIWAMVGVGINVSNEQPTTFINNWLNQNEAYKLEEVLAISLNEYERLLSSPTPNIINEYEKHMMNLLLEVDIMDETCENKRRGKIVGINKDGFLNVIVGKESVVVHPDGNTFDMMKNLIRPKI